MGMFCYQCQEASKGTGCTIRGVCGKTDDVANMQDLLIYVLKGISIYATRARELGVENKEVNKFVVTGLFMTITNANFSKIRFVEAITKALELREVIKTELVNAGGVIDANLPECATWIGTPLEYEAKSIEVGVLKTENEDIRSLRELVTYGIKGMAAYADHAFNLGYENSDLYAFMQKGLAQTTDDTLSVDELVALTLECGKYGVDAMALLDNANTTTYGNPEITKVNIGVRNNPGILISGHDLKEDRKSVV